MRNTSRNVILAVILATIFAGAVGFGGWLLNQSELPPLGGGACKLIVLPAVGVWIAVFALVVFESRDSS